jgi:hypothetical protein
LPNNNDMSKSSFDYEKNFIGNRDGNVYGVVKHVPDDFGSRKDYTYGVVNPNTRPPMLVTPSYNWNGRSEEEHRLWLANNGHMRFNTVQNKFGRTTPSPDLIQRRNKLEQDPSGDNNHLRFNEVENGNDDSWKKNYDYSDSNSIHWDTIGDLSDYPNNPAKSKVSWRKMG